MKAKEIAPSTINRTLRRPETTIETAQPRTKARSRIFRITLKVRLKPDPTKESLRRRSRREVLEARELADERQLDDADRADALLADDDLRHAVGLAGRLTLVAVHVLAIDEHHDVGLLFERARF